MAILIEKKNCLNIYDSSFNPSSGLAFTPIFFESKFF